MNPVRPQTGALQRPAGAGVPGDAPPSGPTLARRPTTREPVPEMMLPNVGPNDGEGSHRGATRGP
jgi:hypothetical protein